MACRPSFAPKVSSALPGELSLFDKESFEQPLRFSKFFLGQNDRLRLVDRALDQAFLVQPVQGVPV